MSTSPGHLDLRQLIVERRASFALGVPGITAEFHWIADEPAVHDDGALAVETAHGALRITPCGAQHAALAAAGDHDDDNGADVWWLPAATARLDTACGLREIGADVAAVKEDRRGDVLFDLGFGVPHLRACVRTRDPRLLDVLRAHAGGNLLAPGHPAMAAIKAASPERVFETRMARIEVLAPIPSRARGERTPRGPHTHVLPALIGRPDPASRALPDGACIVLAAYRAER